MNARTASLAFCFRNLAALLAIGASLFTPACVAESDEDGAAAEDESCTVSETRECEVSADWTAQGVLGVQTCLAVEGEDPQWGGCEMSGSSTPLVLSFDRAPITFGADASASFDLTGSTMSVVTDWPAAITPWLALDRDGNGTIDHGGELFGSATRLSSGARAQHGFEALRELDSNGDGRLSAADEAFGKLVTWSDHDGNRATSAGELSSLSALGIVAIDLGVTLAPRCDSRGNCEGERASFRFVGNDGQERVGEVVDVYLAHQ